MKEFTLERDLDASIDEVWEAWVDPDQISSWLHPEGVSTPRESVDFDVRAGGTYRYTMVNDATGERYPTGGVYRVVERPHRLVFTWGNESDTPEEQMVVTVTLAEDGDRTRLTLHLIAVEELLPPSDEMIRHGWDSALDVLAGHLATVEAGR